ncbi:hypothetical protein CASFOL_018065 [Castilleja foliolosa]|uniref:Mitochondrial carrier protein n=1 Tax=Castilleja foliolosa TaxID=1961234 RepID=A0ABD3D7U5_9LAMI
MTDNRATLAWREIPGLNAVNFSEIDRRHSKYWYSNAVSNRRRRDFACISVSEPKEENYFSPTSSQLLKHPLAMVAMVPKDAALFAAGAIAGAAAKTVTAPLDRVKLLMQTHGLRVGQYAAKKGIGFIEESCLGIVWEGRRNKRVLERKPPLVVIRVIPYSAVQLFAYEAYKKLFQGKDGELSVIGRLAAGACAGMTSTLVTYPLDVLRLRLAIEPGYKTMTEGWLKHFERGRICIAGNRN